MADNIKPISLADRDALEYLASMAKQANAQPQEILSVLVREFQKSGRTIRINRVWSLKTLADSWKKEHGDDFLTGPLSAEKVKIVTEALKTRLKETELALKEADAGAPISAARAADKVHEENARPESAKSSKASKAKAKASEEEEEDDYGSLEELQQLIEEGEKRAGTA